MPKEPEFLDLDLSKDIDAIWPKVQDIFKDMVKLNDEITTAVKLTMEEKALLSKYSKDKEEKSADFPPNEEGDENGALQCLMTVAVAAGRQAFDEPMMAKGKKEIEAIRKEAAKKSDKPADKKKLDDMVNKAFPKVKDVVVPKVDHSKAKEGVILITLPDDYKQDKVSGAPKVPLDTFMKLFELVQEIGAKKIKEIKERIEKQLAEIKEKAGPSKLSEAAKDRTKDMGMGAKLTFLKTKGNELAENGKRAAILKEFMEVLINKVKELAQMFVNAFQNALKFAMKREPEVTAFFEGLPAPPNHTDIFPKAYAPPKEEEKEEAKK